LSYQGVNTYPEKRCQCPDLPFTARVRLQYRRKNLLVWQRERHSHRRDRDTVINSKRLHSASSEAMLNGRVGSCLLVAVSEAVWIKVCGHVEGDAMDASWGIEFRASSVVGA
jgi:hypothetical protein